MALYILHPQRLQIAAVVAFYMASALTVGICLICTAYHCLILFVDGLRVRPTRSLRVPFLHSTYSILYSNKAVLNSSPDLPMIFLLFQLLIAVFLLHLSAVISKKIQIPKLDLQVAKSLIPVVSVNIIGLVFNTLCLRDVEASFFQVIDQNQ